VIVHTVTTKNEMAARTELISAILRELPTGSKRGPPVPAWALQRPKLQNSLFFVCLCSSHELERSNHFFSVLSVPLWFVSSPFSAFLSVLRGEFGFAFGTIRKFKARAQFPKEQAALWELFSSDLLPLGLRVRRRTKASQSSAIG
jgi:hypothetical protein